MLDVGAGDAVCPRGADIYYVDLDTIATMPPRALTSDTATQAWPVLRGDRVAYVDYGDDPYDPGGCPGNSHARFTIATTSVAHGGRGVAVTDGLPMEPERISGDRVYLGHLHGFGFAPLP